MNLPDKIRTLLRRFVPTESEIPLSSRGEPGALSHTLTTGRLMEILRTAESGECRDLFALYRDIRLTAHVQTVTNQRKLAVLTKTLSIVPVDAKDPLDRFAAEACKKLTQSAGWQTSAMSHLLNGHLYPVAVLEQVYQKAAPNPQGLRYLPAEWNPVPYHLLDYTDGTLKLWDADPSTGQRLGTKRELQPVRHIVHRGHLLTDIPDNWGGPMRAALFWWMFATMDRDWWVQFLSRFGAPFIVGRYDVNDPKSKGVLSRAFSNATRLFGLVVSKETDIELHSVATASHGEAFEKLQTFANAELSKLFLGQTMTVTAQAGGLGGAQATVQENTLGDIESWDLSAIAATVNAQIIAPFLEMNGLRGKAEMQLATDTAKDLAGKASFLETATKAGLELTDDGIAILSQASGLPFRRSAALPPLSLAAFSGASESALTARLRATGQPTNDQLDRIARAGAPALAEAFTGRYAVIPGMIAASTSPEDLRRRLAAHFSTTPPARISALIEESLIAYTATAAASLPPTP